MTKIQRKKIQYSRLSILIYSNYNTFSLQPSEDFRGSFWARTDLAFSPSLSGCVYWLQHVGTMHWSKMWGMHVKTNAYIHPHTHTRTHMLIPAVAGTPQSSFPRCHTHFPVISLHIHSTGALNLWRRRLLGGFGLQIQSEDSSNNCRWAEMDTDTGLYSLISDEKFECVCQIFTQIRVFKLLKVSQGH